MSETLIYPAEDFSHLPLLPTHPNVRHVYEPLTEIITDEDLRPYCCYDCCVYFYSRWDAYYRDPIHKTEFQWRSGQTIESDGQPYELISARCVYRQGQWCMRWMARRVEG